MSIQVDSLCCHCLISSLYYFKASDKLVVRMCDGKNGIGIANPPDPSLMCAKMFSGMRLRLPGPLINNHQINL